MQAFRPFYRYFEFKGRSGRAEYWQYAALSTVAGWILGAMDSVSLYGNEHTSYRFTMIFLGLNFIPGLAVAVRRLHDRGKSGWTYLIAFGGVLLAMLFVLLGNYMRLQTGNDTLMSIGAVLFCLMLVPGIYCAVQFFLPGDRGLNQYGPPDNAASSVDLTSITKAFSPPPSPSPTVDPLIQIERLAKMRDAGMLTDEEFQQQKAAYLERLDV